MEQGPPAKYGPFFTPEFNTGTPYYRTPRQLEKQPLGITEAEPQSFIAMLNGAQNSDAHQMGPSFSRPPVFMPPGNSNLSSQQPYPVLNNMMLENPPQFRATGNLGSVNPTHNTPNYGINLPNPINGSNYGEGSSSRPKGKLIPDDDIIPNYPPIWNALYGGDQGYNGNLEAGYSVYDERYQALGIPVDPHLRMFKASIYGNGNFGYNM